MKNFDFIEPNQFALLATLLGILLNLTLDADEQNSLGNFFVSLGQANLTSASQIANQKAHNIGNDDICKQIDNLSAQLEDLKKQLRNK